MTEKKNKTSAMRICRCGIVIVVLNFFFGGFYSFMVSLVALIIVVVCISIIQAGNSNKGFNPNPAPNAPPQAAPVQQQPTPTPAPVVQQPPRQHRPQVDAPDLDVMFCPLCGERVSGNAKFCNACGGKID